MASECLLCGALIEQGIVCANCDRPHRAKLSSAVAVEPFPNAPVAPMETVNPAITSVAHVLVAAAVPALVLGSDRSVRFMTEELKKLFGLTASDPAALKKIEQICAMRFGPLTAAESRTLQIRERRVQFAQVPLTGGAALVFRPLDSLADAHSSFASFVRETVLQPLRSLRDSMRSARGEQAAALLRDGSAALDQILSSLQMAPGVEELPPAGHVPKVVEVVRDVVTRYVPFAELKEIRLESNLPEIDDRFRDHDQLADALGVLLDNSLHYVRGGGHIVVGVRAMEHKDNPILLFFVMDNGPLVPEHLRHLIFEPGFVWNASTHERSGGNLSKVREFAVAHGGSVWVDARTGKACTFFLRVTR